MLIENEGSRKSQNPKEITPDAQVAQTENDAVKYYDPAQLNITD